MELFASSGTWGTLSLRRGSVLIILIFSSLILSQGLVLGIYSKDKEDDVPQFTIAGENFDKLVSGKLRKILDM